MLSLAKPILEKKLLDILYNAYMSQYSTDPEAGNCNLEAKKSFEKAASKFAQTAAGPCAQAIYDFVKEIGIQSTVTGTIVAPPMPPALPGGPCNGVISPLNIIVS